MLLILNLEWPQFSISKQVVEGNQYLEELSQKLGVSNKIVFNCASVKAGETLLPFAQGELGNNKMPDDDTLDYLRWQHQQVRRVLWDNHQTFRANRDLTEMLDNLRKSGHQLAAVVPTKTEHIDAQLKESRIRDYFEDFVYGYDRRLDRLKGDFTLAALYVTAIESADADHEETLVVSDDAVGIEDAIPVHTRAVVGYLNPYVDWDEQGRRLKEMEAAGANYTVVGGHYVTALPFYITGQSEQISKKIINELRQVGRGRDIN